MYSFRSLVRVLSGRCLHLMPSRPHWDLLWSNVSRRGMRGMLRRVGDFQSWIGGTMCSVHARHLCSRRVQRTRKIWRRAMYVCCTRIRYIYTRAHAHNSPIVLLQVLFMMNHNVRQMTLLLCRSSTQVLPALPTGLRHPMAVPCARSARTSVSLPFPDLRNVTAPWKDISLTQPLQR